VDAVILATAGTKVHLWIPKRKKIKLLELIMVLFCNMTEVFMRGCQAKRFPRWVKQVVATLKVQVPFLFTMIWGENDTTLIKSDVDRYLVDIHREK
jgi:hypothetical protein